MKHCFTNSHIKAKKKQVQIKAKNNDINWVTSFAKYYQLQHQVI